MYSVSSLCVISWFLFSSNQVFSAILLLESLLRVLYDGLIEYFYTKVFTGI